MGGADQSQSKASLTNQFIVTCISLPDDVRSRVGHAVVMIRVLDPNHYPVGFDLDIKITRSAFLWRDHPNVPQMTLDGTRDRAFSGRTTNSVVRIHFGDAKPKPTRQNG
jgi:hypothetical protein